MLDLNWPTNFSGWCESSFKKIERKSKDARHRRREVSFSQIGAKSNWDELFCWAEAPPARQMLHCRDFVLSSLRSLPRVNHQTGGLLKNRSNNSLSFMTERDFHSRSGWSRCKRWRTCPWRLSLFSCPVPAKSIRLRSSTTLSGKMTTRGPSY